jgi:hypothetical protein
VFRRCVLVALFLSSCSTLRTKSSTTQQASEFQANIARIQRADPKSPAVLSARLSYAEFLVSTDDGPCQRRLARAEEQLNRVAADPETQVMFPEGWARMTDLDYRLHLARADCVGDPGRAAELRAAVGAAQQTAELYASTFDYHAAVIMRFNTAIVLRRLGDAAAAVTALESTLAMDRDYGFQDDAQENYKLLLTWRGEGADGATVARLMQDFPQRRAILKFAWHPGYAHISLEDDRLSRWNAGTSRSHATASFDRHIGPNANSGWQVIYTQDTAQYEPGVWPTPEGLQAAKVVFWPVALPALNFEVSASGEFTGTLDADAFASRLIAQTDALIRAHVPVSKYAAALTKEALDVTDVALSSGLLMAEAAENYQLETSMWAGATLDQGVWYQLSAPLSLRGLSRLVVQQQLEFAFTHMVPCATATAEPACVELVVRTTPDRQAVDRLFKSYASSTATRIVLDPATLLCYAREDRLYWYVAIGDGRADTVLQSEHFKSTTTFTDGARALSPAPQ